MNIRNLATTIAILAWLALPAPAFADCQLAGPLPQEIAKAPLVFVGTVVATGNGQGAPPATLRVEEVWVGDVPDQLVIQGLSDDQSPVEDDRLWQVGDSYLVLPIIDGNAVRDHICTATRPWDDELAALRPANLPPTTGGQGDFPFLPVILGVAVLGLMVAAFIGPDWIARKRRRLGEG